MTLNYRREMAEIEPDINIETISRQYQAKQKEDTDDLIKSVLLSIFHHVNEGHKSTLNYSLKGQYWDKFPFADIPKVLGILEERGFIASLKENSSIFSKYIVIENTWVTFTPDKPTESVPDKEELPIRYFKLLRSDISCPFPLLGEGVTPTEAAQKILRIICRLGRVANYGYTFSIQELMCTGKTYSYRGVRTKIDEKENVGEKHISKPHFICSYRENGYCMELFDNSNDESS